MVDLPLHQGKPWRLNAHQGRKTFARFIGKRDRTGLHALQEHLGHVSRVMTDAAYVGTDFELGELINNEVLKETRATLEDLLTASNLSGHAGRMIASRSPFRGRTQDGELGEYLDFILKTAGWCWASATGAIASTVVSIPPAKVMTMDRMQSCEHRAHAPAAPILR